MEAIQPEAGLRERHALQIEAAGSGSIWERLARRTLDVTIASLALFITSPLLLLTAIAIRLDSRGGVIFRQRRVGLNGVQFTIHKFRTMRPDADSQPHRDYIKRLITEREERQTAGGETIYKLTLDDRVTRLGRLLRRTSIDELPQLWDVLRGRMALVGPRPVPRYELEDYPPEFYKRLAVKPGVTGLWQVSGRNKLDYHEMIDLDIEYVESRTIWLDLMIVMKTPWVVISSAGVA